MKYKFIIFSGYLKAHARALRVDPSGLRVWGSGSGGSEPGSRV